MLDPGDFAYADEQAHVTAADLDAWAADRVVPRCPECGDTDGRHFRCCPRHDPWDVA